MQQSYHFGDTIKIAILEHDKRIESLVIPIIGSNGYEQVKYLGH